MEMITYNENDLRELAKDAEKWREFKPQFYALKKLFDELSEQVSNRLYEEQKIAHKKSLQALKQGTTVYLVNNNAGDIPYGAELRKVSNGQKYMLAVYKGARWNFPYSWLAIEKPDEATVILNIKMKKIITGK